ncbi:FHA domain-containing protein [Frigoribacterium salinisoli]
MTCPTCASPLPAGAMFCGECGRAVTSADVAAQRSSAEAAARRPSDPTASTPPPAWRSRADRHVPGRDVEPWWVRERVEPDAAPGPADHHLGPAPGSAPEPGAAPATPSPGSGAPAAPDEHPVVPPGAHPDLTSWPPPVVPRDTTTEIPPSASSSPLDRPSAEAPRDVTDGGPTPPARPETARPEAARPETARPGATRPETIRPGAAAPGAARPAPTQPPALRAPEASADHAPRAPLWTASLAPLPAEDRAEEEQAGAEEHGAEEHGADEHGTDEHEGAEREGVDRQGRALVQGPVSGTGSASTPGSGDTVRGGDDVPAPVVGDGTVGAAADGPDGPADPQTEIDLDADGPADALPAPGDTALFERLLPDVAPAVPSDVDDRAEGEGADAARSRRTTDAGAAAVGAAPPPLVEPGSAGERCTQCGGPIHEDDIFCGECGAVVQSVARSFTGPVVPLTPGWRPPVVDGSRAGADDVPRTDPGDAPAPGAPTAAGSSERPTGAPTAAGASAADASSARATPDDAADRPDTGRVRRSGRRARDVPADAPRQPRPVPASWSPPTVPGAPAAPEPSTGAPLAGEDPDATKRRLVDEAARRALAWPPSTTDAPRPGGSAGPARDADVPGALLPPVDHVPGVVRAAPPERPVAPSVPPAPQADTPDGSSPWAAVRASVPQGQAEDDDDVDETRIVAPRPGAVEYGLQFSTGESVTVSGSGLLGRAPVAQPGERFDHLVRLVDPGKSVSKTHLEFGLEGGHLWVSDRWSGNGTLVRAVDQPPRRVQPGTRVRVPRGARVDIGEQFFLVQ